MRNGITILVGVALLCTSAAAAQTPVAPGSRVRTIPQRPFESRRTGKVISASNDSMVVALEVNSEMGIPPDTTQLPNSRLEVSVATRRHAALGAVVFAVPGVLLGVAIGRQLDHVCYATPYTPRTCDNVNDGAKQVLGIGGGLVFAGIGALVGHFVETDTWKSASSDVSRASVSAILGSQSIGLAFHLTTARLH